MTNEELQAHLDAIRQAMKAGEVEEYCADIHEWNAPTQGVVLVAIDEKLERPLRIKPEPREVWVNFYHDEPPCYHDSEADAYRNRSRVAKFDRVVCFREVLQLSSVERNSSAWTRSPSRP